MPEVIDQTVYQRQGYDSRKDYLRCMAEEYGISLRDVLVCADMLGPNEDFDGLVTTLQDMADEEMF